MNESNPDYANRSENFANTPAWQLTLRQLQQLISSKRFWIGLVAVISILTVVGPFDTQRVMTLPTRLVYWSIISVTTFFAGQTVSFFALAVLTNKGVHQWLARLIGGILTGPTVAIIVWAINIYLFDMDISHNYSFWVFAGYTTVISIAVIVLFSLVSTDNLTPASPAQPASKAFFGRLPKHLGAQLISLEAQDHYLKVTTTKGNELILMRLSDAIKELENYAGARVHRSWWVAFDEIAKAERLSGRAQLTMNDGNIVPVSRANIKILVAKGIL